MTPEQLNNVQLIFFLAGGYLVSRLMIKAKLPESIVFWLIGRKPLSTASILLYLIGITSVLGVFIHHVIVVLTLLPLARLILDEVKAKNPGHDTLAATMLAACLMYGANIGGIGTLTSSAANGILLAGANGILPGLTHLGDVPGAEKLTFFLWMVWGVPLVLVYTFVAWLVLVSVYRTRHFFRVPLSFDVHASLRNPFRRLSIIVAGVTFGSAFLLSMLSNVAEGYIMWWTLLTALLFTGIIAFLFLTKVETPEGTTPLLTFRDCLSDLPKRGITLVIITVALAFLLGLVINFFEDALTNIIGMMVSPQTPVIGLFFILALFGTFTTELLSNTVIQYALFALMPSLTSLVPFPLLLGMIVATLASSSAFMSPLSTGVNSLAFGEMKGASLKMLLLAGLVMNVVGSLLVAVWTLTVIRWVLGL